MKRYNKAIGHYGEDIASKFLSDKGYVILDRNFRNRFGEIDIICKHKNIIIFFEIKSRYTSSYGNPMESVTYYKQKQIIKLSNLYLISNKYFNYYARYDVIEVTFNTSLSSFNINHIEDAFRSYWSDNIFFKNDILWISLGPNSFIPKICFDVPYPAFSSNP